MNARGNKEARPDALSQSLSPEETARWTRVGMLAALALLLSYAETFVPIPIPGVKLGLANIAVLVALAQGDAGGAAYVALIKVLAAGLLFGSPYTMLYSLMGTLLALAGMVPLSRLRTMRVWMLSVVGAVLHVLGQLVVATLLMGTAVVWFTSPYLLLASCATGATCGVLAEKITRAVPAERSLPTHGQGGVAPLAPPRAAKASFILLVVFTLVVFHLNDPRALGICLAIGLASCAVARVSLRTLARLLGPLVFVGLLTYVLQRLVAPATALEETLRAELRLASLATASLASMQTLPRDNLSATVAWLILPLTRAGVRTAGFVLAFDVALRVVPELVDVVREGAGLEATVKALYNRLA